MGRVELVIRREVAELESEMARLRATLPQTEPERTHRVRQHTVIARRRVALLTAQNVLDSVDGG
jgi:hypothetical protein